MCGIVGYVGELPASQVIVDGLRRLEYRGYDSAGIATIPEGRIEVRRKKGKLSELQALLMQEPIQGHTGIGHTRWATHGRPSDDNAHPHHVGDIVLVHNGIIENYLELKEELAGSGVEFTSETDTEIVAHLVHQAEGPDLISRVRKALKKVRGAYAIVVLSEQAPDELVVAKNASPLILGQLEGAGIVASDIPAVLPYTRDIIILEEGEMAVINRKGIALSTLEGEPLDRSSKRIDWSPVMAEKGGHKHFMHKEMHEQPRAVIDTLRGRLGEEGMGQVIIDDELIDAVASANHLVYTACGTSYHACMVGRLAMEEIARIHSEADLASELRYRDPLFDDKTVLITVSQSGETADTLAALKEAKAKGIPSLSVVNVLDASIARASDWTFYTHAGPEIGVASTKAFVTQVVALLLLAIGAGRKRGKINQDQARELLTDIRAIPRHIETVLHQEAAIHSIAQRMVDAKSALFLGRGYEFPVALEGALKLKEISYIHAEGYAAGEMKHGPIALVEPGIPCLFIATDSPVYEKTVSNLQEVKAREGFVIAVATEGDTRIAEIADAVIYVPKVAPCLSPLVSTIPLQLLSYHVADLRGTDIDQPRNLAKSVTVE